MQYFRLIFAALTIFSFLSVATAADAQKRIAKPQAKATKSKKAASADQESETGLYVEAMDPSLDMKEFKAAGYKVVTPPEEKEEVPAERDTLFKEAGMGDDVKGWDNFERDMFTRRSQTLTVERMRHWYPKISEAKIKRHQALLKKLRSKI